ncbi:PepSY domain-containing protein [Peptoniphilus equinus]|uniref:PepSY domain-containing protein n=1 Tax=Peptoniphilus equinus TaxID=3016343 RepID=A0ABY7QTL2_9FIRM|nr:PepSY domain-containing protein [Peptoniphilus equinus]WBW50136.1 PepSY domain-containing protein [Peptoniphilus equinus]
MNTKVLSIATLSLLLVGCGQTKTTETTTTTTTTTNTTASEEVKDAVNSVQNAAGDAVDGAKDAVSDAKDAVQSATSGTASQETDAVTAATGEKIQVTPEQALATFKELHPNAALESISLDNDDGRGYYYEVQGYTDSEEYEVEIDPVTGEVSRDKVEQDKHNNDVPVDEALVAKIMDLAQKAADDAGRDTYYVTSWDLSYDDGMNELELELNGHNVPELEYRYNASTGDLLEKDA